MIGKKEKKLRSCRHVAHRGSDGKGEDVRFCNARKEGLFYLIKLRKKEDFVLDWNEENGRS